MKECILKIEKWYQENKRDLPWRKDKDPYHVWISEIMLQQTRIEAVIGYYDRFMKEIPTIHNLSIMDEDRLLKLWEGLGYYNRARNLKKAAIMIEDNYQGVFPTTYQEIIKLNGIGEYTASAISSICFSEKQATIDGNVFRVFTRFYNDFSNIDLLSTKKRIHDQIVAILPKDTGSFNEALMEVGETICIPNGTPLCNKCPLQKKCLAYQEKTFLSLPVRKEKSLKKELKYTVFLFIKDDKILIQKRKSSGILANMWEFPNVVGHLSEREVTERLKENQIVYRSQKKSISYTHIFTHQKWNMISYFIYLDHQIDGVWKTITEIKKEYALPSAFIPFLESFEKETKN